MHVYVCICMYMYKKEGSACLGKAAAVLRDGDAQ